MITLFICAVILQQPNVSGATSVDRINDPELAGWCSRVGYANCILSDDGKAVFLYDGKIRSFVLGSRNVTSAEAIFYYKRNDELLSYTTSQYSHLTNPPKERINPLADIRMVSAPTADRLLLGAILGNTLRNSDVRLKRRGAKPNFDHEVGPKFAVYPLTLSARAHKTSVTWYVLQGRRNLTGKLYSITSDPGDVKEKYIGDCGPGLSYTEFDLQSKVLISGPESGKFLLTKVGWSIAQSTALPKKDAIPFLSRGKIMATADRVYVRSPNKIWEPLGSFRLLAQSRNGVYWLVEDKASTLWRIRF